MSIDPTVWKDIPAVDLAELARVRLALHHAAQVVSALGATHREADEDHQYSNLGWSAEHRALLCRPVGGLQAGLRLHDARWRLVRGSEVLAEKSLAGAGLEDGLAWLGRQVAHAGGPSGALEPVGYELPEHPVASGAPFGELPGHPAEVLARWFESSAAVLEELSAIHLRASAVRCWPHHFDIATLIRLNDETGESARTVGAGMTPGDGGIDQPYFYVSPWPYPERRAGPELPAGGWHTEGWFGAVLRAADLPGSDQGPVVASFLKQAVHHARDLAGA